jgi:hypothetical protein
VDAVVEVPEDAIVAESPSAELTQAAAARKYTAAMLIRRDKAKMKSDESSTDRVMATLERDRKEFQSKNHIKVKKKKKKKAKAPVWTPKAQKAFQKKSETATDNVLKNLERHRKEFHVKNAVKKATKKTNKKEKAEKTAAKKLKEILKREAATQKAVKQHSKLAKLLNAKQAQKRKEKKRKLAKRGRELERKARQENEQEIKIEKAQAYGSAWRHRVRKFQNEYTSSWLGPKVSPYQAKMVVGIMSKPDGSASYFVPDLADWHPSQPVSKAKLEALKAFVNEGPATGSGTTVKFADDCEMWCKSPAGKKYCCQPVGDPMPVLPGMATPKEDPIPVKEPAFAEDMA